MPSAASEASRPWTIRDAVGPGIVAVKNDWRPFLLIQVVAFVLVFSYYRSADMRSAAEQLSALKVSGGLWFAFAAGAFAGGIVPEIAKAMTRTLRRRGLRELVEAAHVATVFGVVGVLVDLFYQFQGFLFGTGIDARTLIYKTLFDMGAFAPLFCVPLEVAALEWGHHGYKMRVLFGNLSALAYRDRVLPAMIPCWAFWIPVLFCVYALPLNLQFPFAILAEAAWSIIVVCVTRRGSA